MKGMEHPDDMTLSRLAFPQECADIDPKWKLHALECSECMDTILMLREMKEEGLFEKNNSVPRPYASPSQPEADYKTATDSETPYARVAAGVVVGGGLVDRYESLSLDMETDPGDAAACDAALASAEPGVADVSEATEVAGESDFAEIWNEISESVFDAVDGVL